MELTIIWAFVIAFAVFMYVVMDGFDLGIGILFPSFKPGEERTQAMNAIAPVWDGNETWLVLGGGGRPTGLCDHPAGDLPADYCHAARPHLSRRSVRISPPRPGP